MDAKQWMNNFEQECARFNIQTDEKKIEILRLFMDKSCTDWYHSMIIKLTWDSDWTEWKNKFCDSFANKGWYPVTYAINYRYKEGLLIDYAIRKEKLLLDMRKTMDTESLIDLIAAGLPDFILNRIDRELLKDTADLFNELSKYEHMVNKKNNPQKKNKYLNNKINNTNEEKKACEYYKKLNKGTRYHPESKCWFKINTEDREKYGVKCVNNSTIETELNETEQKNE